MDNFGTVTAPPQTGAVEAVFMFVLCIIVIIYCIYLWWTQPTQEEMDELGDIIVQFHKDPDYEDFMKVWKQRYRLIANTGKPIKYWLWGVYITQPQYFDYNQKAELDSWVREIERGLNQITIEPTPILMDCIWNIYYATGESKYANVIKNLDVDGIDPTIRLVARHSYRTIMQINAGENNTATNE